MDQPLASVIIIFLDEKRFLGEAIDSLLAQTYQAWELLLVDDGSTDGSRTLALSYVEAYPGKIRYLEHEGHQNRGMSASRNLGMRHARGRYLAFLDADDVWLPGKLERQVAILNAHPAAGMVYGRTEWWYSWGPSRDGRQDFVLPLGVPPDTLVQPPKLLIQFLKQEELSPCTCSMLVRREVVERVGDFEESFRGLYEDQAFCAKVCLEMPVFASGECWARYRQHPDSATVVAQKAGQHRSARLRFLEWLARYLRARGVAQAEVWHTVQAERRRCRYPWLYRTVGATRQLGRRVSLRGRALAWRLSRLPIARELRWAGLRRLRPVADGRQRGTPIVRYYWTRFLDKYRSDIRGAALEIGTTETVRRYGGAALTRADGIDLAAHSPQVSVVADLTRADHLAAEQYDCFVNQFSMHLIYDLDAALYHSLRVLKRGGVLLVNFPCVDYYLARGLDMGTGGPLFMYWWFTPIQVEGLLRRAGLLPSDYRIEIFGNLVSRIAYQMNLPAEELAQRELDSVDPGHPLLICVRAVKPDSWQAPKPEYRDPWRLEVTPAEWNPDAGHYAR